MSQGDNSPRILTTRDVEERINFLERLLGGTGPEDEYLAALLNNQAIKLQQDLRNSPFVSGPVAEQGNFTDQERSLLPIDAVGVLAEDINTQAFGDAVFRLEGSVFIATVQNIDTENLDAGAAVQVTEAGNKVESAGAAASVSGLFSEASADTFRYRGQLRIIPRVTEADETVKVSNQTYENGEYDAVSPGLEAGEQKIVARITADRDEFILLRATNATSHPTVRYEYFIDAPPERAGTEPDPSLSGAQPWATPPDLYNVVPDGYQLVDEDVVLRLNETSGNTSYDNVQGTLTALVLRV